MKKIISFISIAFILSGCMYQTVNRSDIEAGIIVCSQKQATLIEISADYLGGERVLCSNRETYIISNSNMNPVKAL